MPIDTALHFTLLSGNDHSQENEENQIFEPIQTFKNNEDAVDFVDNGSIFDCLDNDENYLRILTLKTIVIY